MNQADFYLEQLQALANEEIPAHVLERARMALLDYIGVTLAGRREQTEKIESLIRDFASAGGSVYPVGISTPMGINDAVFLNGLNAHALDFDDGTNAGIIHLGSPIFSVLLALAQCCPIDGKRLLEAVVLGYEASFTMAMTIQPQHKKRGYHATGTCGVFGIVTAAAHALQFTPEQFKNAFSTAAVSASGTLKVLEDGSDLKPYNVAKTALLGLLSVWMARAGFVGADDALHGVAGFLSQMYGTDEVRFADFRLDGTYAIEKAYIKPYAACRYCHPSIDVAQELRKEKLYDAGEIAKVQITTYDLAVKKHDHTDIRGAASAKMSIPYNFAATYLTGKTGMDAFAGDVLDDPAVRALVTKVQVTEDPAMTVLFPAKTIASVRLTATDGTVLTGSSELPKGEPENPLSEAEARDKFRSLACYGGRTEQDASKIISAVDHVENDLSALLELLR